MDGKTNIKFIDAVYARIRNITDEDNSVFIILKNLYALYDEVLSCLRPVEDAVNGTRKKTEVYHIGNVFINDVNTYANDTIDEALDIIRNTINTILDDVNKFKAIKTK